jgi:hypothetical protein
MKNIALAVTSLLLISAISPAFAEPMEISRNGHDVMYISDVHPGTEGLSPDVAQMARQFGTYDSLSNSVVVDQAKVFVGTIVTKENGVCTETTHAIERMDERKVKIGSHTSTPGTPVMKMTPKVVPCPA